MKRFFKTIRPYLLSVLLALAVGGLSAWVTRGAMARFETLQKPPLAPPGWLFPVIWTILYTLMGVSAALIWRTDRLRRDTPLWRYGVQLVLTFWWPVLFFLLEARLAAFFLLLALIAAVIWMLRSFARLSRTAAWLNAPYLLWLLFAGYLNLGVYLLNR